MERKIIKVTPVVEEFTITWMIGKFCNYDCMYCPSDWHDDQSKPHDLETLKQVWMNIKKKSGHNDLKYKIVISGGEPTANKSFLPFLEWLREDDSVSRISVTTNGSASLKYYERLSDLVESLSFSTHSEFMDERSFFEKVNAISNRMCLNGKDLHVNVMNEPWNRDRISLYENYLGKHKIRYTINEIQQDVRTRDEIKNEGKANIDEIL